MGALWAAITVDVSLLVTLALAVAGAVSTAVVVGARKRDDRVEVLERLLAAYKEEATLEKSKRLEYEAQMSIVMGGFLEKVLVQISEQVGKAIRQAMKEDRNDFPR